MTIFSFVWSDTTFKLTTGVLLVIYLAEIPDMELQADGISESADLFMTDLFIRDPETGITYRQTQLLQVRNIYFIHLHI